MSDTLLTIKEAASILKVHWQTIRNYIDRGELTAHKFGRSLRIKQQDLQALINQNQQTPNQIEIEQRYQLTSPQKIHKLLTDKNAPVMYQAHIIDHWFIPVSIKSRAQHDNWFDKQRGCGVRIREQINDYTGKITTSLETKRLTQAMNHNTFLESSVEVENYQNAKQVVEMMDLKEFLTIDKTRIMYDYQQCKIAIDEIKNFAACVEVETRTTTDRDQALQHIIQVAAELGFTEQDKLEKSLTVLAMNTLAKFDA